jgi:hypothetical protein
MLVAMETAKVNRSTELSIPISSVRGNHSGANIYADANKRQHEAQDAADHAEKHAFGEQLPRYPERRGAQRRSDRDLPLPYYGSTQQQVGHIGATDQKHKADGAKQ